MFSTADSSGGNGNRGLQTMAWFRKADVALYCLHHAISLRKKISEYQASDPCVCRSPHVHELRSIVDRTRKLVNELKGHFHPSHIAQRGLALVYTHMCRAMGWIDKALDSKKAAGALLACRRILDLPMKYIGYYISEFSQDQINRKQVRSLLGFGIGPKLVLCSCDAQFNSFAVGAYLDLSNKILLTTVFMSWKLYTKYPSSFIPRRRKQLNWVWYGPEIETYKCTSLHKRIFMENVWNIRHILDNDQILDIPDTLGTTPLHLAIAFEDTETAIRLINAEVEVNIIEMEAYTPLHMAIVTGNRELIQLLEVHGADLSERSDIDYSPLELAVALEDKSVLQALVG